MNHLPECDKRHPYYASTLPCICDRLRACEQRVIVKTIRTLDIAGTDDRAYVKGHAAGVQAARDAVVALVPFTVVCELAEVGPVLNVDDALAAIDALGVSGA